MQEFGDTDKQDDSWLLHLVDGFKSQSGSPQSWLPVVMAENLKGCSDDGSGEVLLGMPAVGFGVCVC